MRIRNQVPALGYKLVPEKGKQTATSLHQRQEADRFKSGLGRVSGFEIPVAALFVWTVGIPVGGTPLFVGAIRVRSVKYR